MDTNAHVSRRGFLAAAACTATAAALPTMTGCGGSVQSYSPPLRGPLGHGVSVAGAEFGAEGREFSNLNPGVAGKDYTYNSSQTLRYFSGAGVRMFRLPFRWERLQPTLGGALDPTELTYIKQFVNWAGSNHCYVVLDLHNYGRYALSQGGPKVECIIDQRFGSQVPVTREHLADLWLKLATEFRGDAAVAGYGLMNEPHDMGRSDWKAISQHTVNAIRQVDRRTQILVAGDGWSNAHRWTQVNGRSAWINDPADNVAYEAHCYFDHDHTGKYFMSYDREMDRDAGLVRRGVERVQPFVQWCQSNRVQGFVGEYGVPGNDARWVNLLTPFLETLQSAGMSSAYWAAGEWWGAYPLSVQPRGSFGNPAPQLSVLAQHAAARSDNTFARQGS